jgi:hypothetical protein
MLINLGSYVDICATGFTTIFYTTTIYYEACGCAHQVIPTIPVTTATTLCGQCGPNGSPAMVTLTTPCGEAGLATNLPKVAAAIATAASNSAATGLAVKTSTVIVAPVGAIAGVNSTKPTSTIMVAALSTAPVEFTGAATKATSSILIALLAMVGVIAL